MGNLKKGIISAVVCSLLVVTPGLVLAAGFSDGFTNVENFKTNKSGLPNAPTDPKDFILKILGAATVLVAVLALAAIVYAGFLLITDRGSEDNVEKAKKIIIYAVAGLILIGLGGIIVNAVLNIGKP